MLFDCSRTLVREALMQLAARGMIVNTADTAGFRAPLAPFYARWKERLGSKAWLLLEAQVGQLR